MEGDCPAFATVTVTGEVDLDRLDRSEAVVVDHLEIPEPLVDPERFTVRLSGIGGTGVVTVSQILGTAAMLDGASVRGLDQTGLSQKAGPVVSDLRISRGAPAASNHAPAAGVDCLLGFDLLVAASDVHRHGASRGRTVVVASTDAVPTGQMITHPETPFPALGALRGRLDEVSRPEHNRYLDAAGLANGLFGNSTSANLMVLGTAIQIGAVPVDPGCVEQAIGLNGVAVQRNLAAFRWGRLWAVDPEAVQLSAGFTPPMPPESLDQLIDRLAEDLTGHSSARYARHFVEVVQRARNAEMVADPGSVALATAVARNLHKLMAYKDEYEVARLLLLDESAEGYRSVGGPRTEITYLLHPPVLRALGMRRKLRLRRSARPMLRMLRAAAPLRGTMVDPFRWGKVRALERALIAEYTEAVDRLSHRLTAGNLEESIQIASLPDRIRGYEHLKAQRGTAVRRELAARTR
jgi:indolepyruvate ferredoxin oxidoreductase